VATAVARVVAETLFEESDRSGGAGRRSVELSSDISAEALLEMVEESRVEEWRRLHGGGHEVVESRSLGQHLGGNL
jgi:hypothetical protein